MDIERLKGDEETISPDVVSRRDRPIDPAEALRRERDKYGDSSTNPNSDDQWDEHHGQPDDIV